MSRSSEPVVVVADENGEFHVTARAGLRVRPGQTGVLATDPESSIVALREATPSIAELASTQQVEPGLGKALPELFASDDELQQFLALIDRA